MSDRRPPNVPAVVEAGKATRFQKGQSGNPSGKPKDHDGVAALARSYAAEAIEKLAHLMRKSKVDRVQLDAAIALLDRGFGKPAASLELKHDLGFDELAAALIAGRQRIAPDLIDVTPEPEPADTP